MSFSVEINKSMITLSEMFADRGKSDISSFLLNTIEQEEFKKSFQKQYFFIDFETKLRLIFNISTRFKIADGKKFFEDPFETYILVLSEKISTTNLKTIHELCKNIEIFEINELQFNITKHSLVPKHTLVTDEAEITKLVQLYGLKCKVQFPLILKTDPVARYINAKPGNLVRITRYSPSSGEHIVYRYCM